MAFIYFHGVTGSLNEEVWVNTQTYAMSKELPSPQDMLYDVLVSHSKIERDLGELLLLLRDLQNQRKDPAKNDIIEKRLQDYINNHSFSCTLNELAKQYNIPEGAILEDLKKMNALRGDIAHGSFINELFIGEKILKIIGDDGKGFTMNLGKQEQVIFSDTKLLEYNFMEYTNLCQKNSTFFFSNQVTKINLLKGSQNA